MVHRPGRKHGNADSLSRRRDGSIETSAADELEGVTNRRLQTTRQLQQMPAQPAGTSTASQRSPTTRRQREPTPTQPVVLLPYRECSLTVRRHPEPTPTPVKSVPSRTRAADLQKTYQHHEPTQANVENSAAHQRKATTRIFYNTTPHGRRQSEVLLTYQRGLSAGERPTTNYETGLSASSQHLELMAQEQAEPQSSMAGQFELEETMRVKAVTRGSANGDRIEADGSRQQEL